MSAGSLPPTRHVLYSIRTCSSIGPVQFVISRVFVQGHGLLLFFIHTLDPNLTQLNILACPRLEELVLSLDEADPREMESIVEMAVAKVLRGAKLKFVRFMSFTGLPLLLSGLAECVSRVETSSGWGERQS